MVFGGSTVFRAHIIPHRARFKGRKDEVVGHNVKTGDEVGGLGEALSLQIRILGIRIGVIFKTQLVFDKLLLLVGAPVELGVGSSGCATRFLVLPDNPIQQTRYRV